MLYALLLLFAQEDAKSGEGGMPPWATFLPLLLMFGLFYFLIILPQQRRERKQRDLLMNALKKNDEVVTSAGIIGVVTHIKDNADEVTLKIDDKARLRVLKSTIVRILTKEGKEESPK